jgi:hypothetical protein
MAGPTIPLKAEEDARIKAKIVGLFKSTIAVCVVYGAIALAILVVAAATDFGKTFLIEKMSAFTVTLLIGMSLIIAFLGISIFNYKEGAVKRAMTDQYSCPDYFELKATPAATLALVPEDKRFMFEYRCEPIAGVIDGLTNAPPSLLTTASTSETPNPMNKYFGTEANLGFTSDTDKTSCKVMYPMYMDKMDNEKNPANPNKFRCNMINESTTGTGIGCPGLTWTSICPYPPATADLKS